MTASACKLILLFALALAACGPDLEPIDTGLDPVSVARAVPDAGECAAAPQTCTGWCAANPQSCPRPGSPR